jgi:hypothetical protein
MRYDVTCTGEVKNVYTISQRQVGYPSFDRAVMPPKSKTRHSLEAAAKGSEMLKQTRVDPDVTVSPVMEGVISESMKLVLQIALCCTKSLGLHALQ